MVNLLRNTNKMSYYVEDTLQIVDAYDYALIKQSQFLEASENALNWESADLKL